MDGSRSTVYVRQFLRGEDSLEVLFVIMYTLAFIGFCFNSLCTKAFESLPTAFPQVQRLLWLMSVRTYVYWDQCKGHKWI